MKSEVRIRVEKTVGIGLLCLVAGAPLVAGEAPASPPIYGVRVERASIPMKDGVRLAASLFMPAGAKLSEKFPALLEYLPYRKDDGTAGRDYPIHSYFTRRGYVGARVDIRGTGQSEGQTPDREYSEQEQEDGLEVIAWLAPTALVERQRRHVRDLLGWLQLAPARHATSAGAQSHRGHMRHREAFP